MGWTGGITIFCPPGPVPHRKASVNSPSGGGLGRSGIFLAWVAEVLVMHLVVPGITYCLLQFCPSEILGMIERIISCCVVFCELGSTGGWCEGWRAVHLKSDFLDIRKTGGHF